MNYFHQDLVDHWDKMSIFEQMANVGAEVGRAISWRKRNQEYFTNAFYRALELLDFTIKDPKNRNRLGELLRIRELLVDYFAGENIYCSTDEGWEKYFLPFNFAARR